MKFGQNLFHDIEGEGADLLKSVDGDLALQPPLPPLLDQVVVDLAGAEEDLVHLGGALRGGALVQDHPLELCPWLKIVK